MHLHDVVLSHDAATALRELRLLDADCERLLYRIRADGGEAVLSATGDDLDELAGAIAWISAASRTVAALGSSLYCVPPHDSLPQAEPLDDTMQRSRALRRRQSRANTARRLPLRTLRVSTVLAYTDPPIWRRLELASDLRLDELHRVIQAAFQWEGGHLHQFSAEDRTWDDGSAADFGPGAFSASPAPEPEGKTRLSQILVAVGDRLDYAYDFGDNWEHVLVLEEIVEPAPGAPRARLIGGDRAAPLEDCGGIPGYEDLVTALADPENPDHGHLVEWYVEVYGGSPADFDAAKVDVEALDRAVRLIAG